MTDETIFAVALEKPSLQERTEFVAGACETPEQLARVESLLAAHDRASGFLDRPAVVSGPDDDGTRTTASATRSFDPDATADEADATAFLAPPVRPDSLGRIGHYEVLEVLGRGGFGIVFRAFDDVLQRVVAVKVLAPAMAATSPARKRFLREARSAAVIQHEHVVRIHETGESPLPYLVMEFVPGETLQQRIDRTGPLEPAEVLKFARQITAGLAAAHEKGLIHRDIKPSNVLIDAGSQQAKITDFGLARAADDASLTRSGTVAGTPMYMAPEQARGESLDQRADLFSLGSVVYAMLTGHPPFRASNTPAVLKRVTDDTPRSICEVTPEAPEWLCRVVAKLHAKGPDERFQSAKEVAGLLADCERQVLAHGSLQDYSRIPGGRPAGRPSRRKWATVLLATAVVVGAVVGGAVLAVDRLLRRPADDLTTTRPLDPAVWGTLVNPTGNGLASRLDDDLGTFGTLGMTGWTAHELNPATNLFAPRLVRDVDGDFRYEVSVLKFSPAAVGTGHRPGIAWRAAGLLVWQDDGHFFRFETARHTEQRDGAPYLQLEAFPDATADKREYLPADPIFTHLQVERRGDTFTLRTSDDGKAWRDWHSVRWPAGRTLQVGLVACNSSTELFVAGFRPPTLTPLALAADGFVSLFNGKDTSGWVRSPRPDLGEWAVKAGVLEGRTRQRDYLFTERGDYRDFHLRVEAKVNPGGDGGLMLRCERGLGSKFGTAHGYETEISALPDVPHGTLRLGPEGPDNTVLARPIADRAGRWFTQEVIVRGNRIVVKVDGETVLDHTSAEEHYARGHIGLQVWGEKSVVQVRRVEVKELPAE